MTSLANRRAIVPRPRSAGDGAARLDEARQRTGAAIHAIPLIGVAEAAEIARISRTAIRRAWAAGDLPGVRSNADSDQISFRPETVRAWARSRFYIV